MRHVGEGSNEAMPVQFEHSTGEFIKGCAFSANGAKCESLGQRDCVKTQATRLIDGPNNESGARTESRPYRIRDDSPKIVGASLRGRPGFPVSDDQYVTSLEF